MLKGCYILQRIAGHGHNVGQHSGGEATYGSGLAEQFGGHRGARFYRIQGAEAPFIDQEFKLFGLVDGPGDGARVCPKRYLKAPASGSSIKEPKWNLLEVGVAKGYQRTKRVVNWNPTSLPCGHRVHKIAETASVYVTWA